MLRVLACQCGSATPLARKTLNNAGVTNWMSIPIHRGKEYCLTMLSHYPEEFKQLLAFRALEDFISSHGTFVCFVGSDESSFYWADVSKNDPKSVWDAEAIIKQFA